MSELSLEQRVAALEARLDRIAEPDEELISRMRTLDSKIQAEIKAVKFRIKDGNLVVTRDRRAGRD